MQLSVHPLDGPCPASISALQVTVDVRSCPVGFEFSASEQTCTCDRRLLGDAFTATCNIVEQTIHRTGSFWMGFDDERGLILNPNCPFDYCISQAKDIPIDNGDIQ